MIRSAAIAFALGPALPLAAAISALAGETDGAGRIETGPRASLTLERHYTTNALDSETAIPDWFTLLRGSFGHEVTAGGAVLGVGAEFEATRHDEISIEDDLQGAVQVTAGHKFGDRAELRGTVSWSHGVDGDDLGLPGLVIGTRTATDIVAANVQLGIELTPSTAFVLESENSLEMPGETRFEDDIIAPLQLEPERRRHRLTAAISTRDGAQTYGARAYAGVVEAEPIGSPPAALSFSEFGLQGEASTTLEGGATLGFAAGAAALVSEGGAHRETRPVLDLALALPLTGGAALNAGFSAGFETADTDDPLGSWVRRAQIEAKLPLAPRLTFGAGIYSEYVENLLIGYDERGHGVYGELSFAAHRNFSAVLRADYEKAKLIGPDIRRDRLDTFIGIKAAL